MILQLLCHQITAMLDVMRQLGMFYYWHAFDAIPISSPFCH